MKLCVVGGAGYVGLTTAVGFAQLGHDVIAVDVDRERLSLLEQGQSPIAEERMEAALRDSLASGRLRFTANLPEGVSGADVIFVAVGSPRSATGAADVSQARAVAESIGDLLRGYAVIALKSTVPIGTAGMMEQVIRAKQACSPDVVVSPEFLREGHALEDFFFPMRIVIGTGSERARQVMRMLYAPFTEGASASTTVATAHNVPLVETSPEAAHMIKYASNAFLATRVSFINEVSAICERVGADVTDVVKGLGYDPRIGSAYLEPGIGFGGPCLEKDLSALICSAADWDYDAALLQAVQERNGQQVESIVRKARDMLGNQLAGKRVAVLGLAFKANTADVRSSLSFPIIRQLHDAGAVIAAHDPLAIQAARKLLPELAYSDDVYQTVNGADLLLLLTSWPQYASLDFPRIAASMRRRCVVDGWNALPAEQLCRLGFQYVGVGR